MSDIELIIKIPEKVYNANRLGEISPWVTDTILDAVQIGMLLPEGHGNLKDEDEIYELLNSVNGTAELDKAFEAVEQATTIIKADKEDENEYRN